MSIARLDGLTEYSIDAFKATLQRYVDEPDRLWYSRSRFSASPPPVRIPGSPLRPGPPPVQLPSSGSLQPMAPSAQQLHRWRVERDRAASLPAEQFKTQVREQQEHIGRRVEAGLLCLPDGADVHRLATDEVRRSWLEQGIWDSSWFDLPDGRWKHEKPWLLARSDPSTGQVSRAGLFPQLRREEPDEPAGSGGKEAEGKEGRQGPLEQGAVASSKPQTSNGEATRPFHQFVYQLSRENERILSERPSTRGPGGLAPVDINTVAFKIVRDTWTRRGIWDPRWGLLPGMAWKHEWALEDLLADDPAPADVPQPPSGVRPRRSQRLRQKRVREDEPAAENKETQEGPSRQQDSQEEGGH